ncbi:MAG: hypothetical protein NC390_00180 [Fusobacterium sp.]|nr:hypothetical protein [Fusobacterium sp.]
MGIRTNTARTDSTKVIDSKATLLKSKKTAEVQMPEATKRQNEIKNKIEEIKIEIKLLDAYIKEYEDSSGLKGISAWLANKFAGMFGFDTVETYKERKDSLASEMKLLEAELKYYVAA